MLPISPETHEDFKRSGVRWDLNIYMFWEKEKKKVMEGRFVCWASKTAPKCQRRGLYSVKSPLDFDALKAKVLIKVQKWVIYYEVKDFTGSQIVGVVERRLLSSEWGLIFP